jgi:hypothetical protein
MVRSPAIIRRRESRLRFSIGFMLLQTQSGQAVAAADRLTPFKNFSSQAGGDRRSQPVEQGKRRRQRDAVLPNHRRSAARRSPGRVSLRSDRRDRPGQAPPE